MASSSKAKVISLKLVIAPKTNRLLFAEAGKDFVDFLLNLLHLPLGTVISLLKEKTIAGSWGNLYESARNLKGTYFQSTKNKDSALNPEIPFLATQIPLLFPPGGNFLAKKCYYTCPPQATKIPEGNGNYKTLYHSYFSDEPYEYCPSCGKFMSEMIQYVAEERVGAGREGDFVKGEATYMVMDNLEVTPMSTSAWFTMMSKFNVRNVGALEEKVVVLGKPEALKLLNASLHSKKVLTSAFLGK